MASTPIPTGKRNQVLALVKAKSCNDYAYVKQKLVTYDDGLRILFEFSKTFDCDTTYLENILAIFDDSELTGIGVYYNKTSGTITNPAMLVKCTGVTVNVTAGSDEIDIVDGCSITQMNVTADVSLISISGNSVVTELVVDGSTVGGVIVKTCGSYTATLTKIKEQNGGKVFTVIAEPPAVFGGFECVDET